jgi:DNA-binding response OmpR family regulator
MPSLKKALIIDDEKDICLLLRNILENLGINAKYALSLKEAKNLAGSFFPDIVLLDLHLPDGSGFEIIAYFRLLNPRVRVIIQTAYDEEEYKEKARSQGVEHFLIKPVKVPILRNALGH